VRQPDQGALVLGIETSCDETAAAVVTAGAEIRANVIASQVDLHRRYGGVVPEVASRQHVPAVLPVVDTALREAGAGPESLAAVAVTRGPGLVGALLVGVAAAKGLALAWGVDLVGVNHLEGHVYSARLEDPGLAPPYLCLIVSGGHTDLVWVEADGRYRLLGRTRDDAAGEAFDKSARVMGLGYPGGPAIDRAAAGGDPEAVPFPRAMLEDPSLDFSFSGLKTAVVQFYRRARAAGKEPPLADVAASFQQAVVDVLVKKTIRAARETGASRVAVVGGVAANSVLRRDMAAAAARAGLALTIPRPALCTDNAAMIAYAGYHRWRLGHRDDLSLDVRANLPLETGAGAAQEPAGAVANPTG